MHAQEFPLDEYHWWFADGGWSGHDVNLILAQILQDSASSVQHHPARCDKTRRHPSVRKCAGLIETRWVSLAFVLQCDFSLCLFGAYETSEIRLIIIQSCCMPVLHWSTHVNNSSCTQIHFDEIKSLTNQTHFRFTLITFPFSGLWDPGGLWGRSSEFVKARRQI